MNDAPPALQLHDALERHRADRQRLEASLRPLASSLDGQRFAFQVPLSGLRLEIGGYVILEEESGARLGQVVSLRQDSVDAGTVGLAVDAAGRDESIDANLSLRYAAGEGEVLDGEGRTFVDACLRPASVEEIGAWRTGARHKSAELAVGTLALAEGVQCPMRADGFARHTFFCGQSGSGKTYSPL